MYQRSPTTHDEEPVDPAAILRYGKVVSVDLAAGTVTVRTGEVETAPIPFLTGRAGATRHWSPLSEGEQVLLACPGGDIEAAIAIGSIAQDAFPLPANTLRELIAFGDGALLSYDPAAHHLEIKLPAGASMSIFADGGLEIEGDTSIRGNVAIEGDVEVTGTIAADDDVLGGGKSLKNHVHKSVSSGNALSGKPA